MSWQSDLQTEVSASISSGPRAPTSNDSTRASQNSLSHLIARHSALADLLPTSNSWRFYTLGLDVPFTTEKLLSHLADRLLDSAKSIGARNATQTLDNLLIKAEQNDLPGYELTFLHGLKLTERWDIVPGLYLLPLESLPQPTHQELQITPLRHPNDYGINSEIDSNVIVLVCDLRWGPIVVSNKDRSFTDPDPLELQLVFDHNPLLLVSLMAVTLNRPLWIHSTTMRAAPWIEDFLNVFGGGGTIFSPPSHLRTKTFSVPSAEAIEMTKRAFEDLDCLPGSDRQTLSLAISRLSSSLSRSDLLAIQDRILDVSIALEILYQLDHHEITYKLSTRAGWYLERDVTRRIKTRTKVTKFYDLRSRIIHGGVPHRSNHKDDNQTFQSAFEIARTTLLQHLKRRKLPTNKDWSEIVMGLEASDPT